MFVVLRSVNNKVRQYLYRQTHGTLKSEESKICHKFREIYMQNERFMGFLGIYNFAPNFFETEFFEVILMLALLTGDFFIFTKKVRDCEEDTYEII